MDLGIALLRLLVATVLFAHGTSKLLGWFGGAGLLETERAFERLHQTPPRPMVILVSTLEIGSAFLLLLLTPLAAAAATGTMLVAGGTMVITNRTFWKTSQGGEYAFVLAGTGGLLLQVAGCRITGRIHLDRNFADVPDGSTDEFKDQYTGASQTLRQLIEAVKATAGEQTRIHLISPDARQ